MVEHLAYNARGREFESHSGQLFSALSLFIFLNPVVSIHIIIIFI